MCGASRIHSFGVNVMWWCESLVCGGGRQKESEWPGTRTSRIPLSPPNTQTQWKTVAWTEVREYLPLPSGCDSREHSVQRYRECVGHWFGTVQCDLFRGHSALQGVAARALLANAAAELGEPVPPPEVGTRAAGERAQRGQGVEGLVAADVIDHHGPLKGPDGGTFEEELLPYGVRAARGLSQVRPETVPDGFRLLGRACLDVGRPPSAVHCWQAEGHEQQEGGLHLQRGPVACSQ